MGLIKDFKVKNSLCVGESLNVTQSACIGGDTSIYGNLSVYGDETIFRTIVSYTSALSVVNHGTGPALFVRQAGADEPIAEFVDKEGNVFHRGKEMSKLKGTLKPTKVKPPKKRIKRRTRDEILVARHNIKKEVLKKAIKKQKDFLNHKINKG